VDIMPDGNRRWAQDRRFEKQDGYHFGLQPGLEVHNACLALGIPEITFYGFTVDNTKLLRLRSKPFETRAWKP
jgi:undecaprenyl diphosphate synthase